jgi:hypothetical protein
MSQFQAAQEDLRQPSPRPGPKNGVAVAPLRQHRAEVVEYRIEQHAERLGERLTTLRGA